VIAEIAGAQHGVITVAQLRSAGFSPAAVTRLNGRYLHAFIAVSTPSGTEH
jgi:hypothetical protein